MVRSQADNNLGDVFPTSLQYEPCCINYVGETEHADGPIHARYVICPSCKAKVPCGFDQRLRPHKPAPPPYLGCPIDGPNCRGLYPRPAYNNPPCHECAAWFDETYKKWRDEQETEGNDEAWHEEAGWIDEGADDE